MQNAYWLMFNKLNETNQVNMKLSPGKGKKLVSYSTMNFAYFTNLMMKYNHSNNNRVRL